MVEDAQFAKLQERVALLERQITFLLNQAKVAFVDRPIPSVYPDVAELKRKGNIIEAIKLYRSYTDAGLAEAKAFVDNLIV